MTDREIIKALELCNFGKCEGCPFYDIYRCIAKCRKEALYLINRQKTEIDILIRKKETLREENAEQQAEIERKDKILNSYALQYGTVTDQSKKIQEIRTEAIKEFAEILKGSLDISACGYSTEEIKQDVFDTIDNCIYRLERSYDEKLD